MLLSCLHPEDRCSRFLVKNLARGMPESVVREELESLDIRLQEVTQLLSGRRDQDPAKYRPLTPTSLYRWRGDPRCPKCDQSSNSADGMLLYKQLIRPMMNYACPTWRSAIRTHVRRLQVLQSNCLRLASGAPWY
jgi:hypothetical protein